jgi:hypothetical protein
MQQFDLSSVYILNEIKKTVNNILDNLYLKFICSYEKILLTTVLISL